MGLDGFVAKRIPAQCWRRVARSRPMLTEVAGAACGMVEFARLDRDLLDKDGEVGGAARRVLGFLCWLVAGFFAGALIALPPMEFAHTVMIAAGARMGAYGGYMLWGWQWSRNDVPSEEPSATVVEAKTVDGVPEENIWFYVLIIIWTLVFVMMLVM
jgi:hypothetical protein